MNPLDLASKYDIPCLWCIGSLRVRGVTITKLYSNQTWCSTWPLTFKSDASLDIIKIESQRKPKLVVLSESLTLITNPQGPLKGGVNSLR